MTAAAKVSIEDLFEASQPFVSTSTKDSALGEVVDAPTADSEQYFDGICSVVKKYESDFYRAQNAVVAVLENAIKDDPGCAAPFDAYVSAVTDPTLVKLIVKYKIAMSYQPIWIAVCRLTTEELSTWAFHIREHDSDRATVVKQAGLILQDEVTAFLDCSHDWLEAFKAVVTIDNDGEVRPSYILGRLQLAELIE